MVGVLEAKRGKEETPCGCGACCGAVVSEVVAENDRIREESYQVTADGRLVENLFADLKHQRPVQFTYIENGGR